MTTLNEITKRQDGKTFNNYRQADWPGTVAEMTAEEKTGLKIRLEELEKMDDEGADMDVKSDGFTDDEFEDFSDMDLYAEMLILRSIISYENF